MTLIFMSFIQFFLFNLAFDTYKKVVIDDVSIVDAGCSFLFDSSIHLF